MKKHFLSENELRNTKGGTVSESFGVLYNESSSVTNDAGSSGEGETGSGEAEEELP